MTRSNSYDFNLNARQICQMAYENLGVVAEGQDMSGYQLEIALRELNVMVKNWRADNVFLWEVERKSYGLTASDNVENDGSYYECIRNNTAASNNEPGTGSIWELFWKELSDEPSTYGTWTLASTYASICNFSLDDDVIGLGACYIREGDSTSDTFLDTHMTNEEYYGIGDKASSGKPSQIYFKKGYNTSEVFLWPYPDSADYILDLEVYRQIMDLDDADGGDNPDFIQHWLAPLADGLTLRLYRKYPSGDYLTIKDAFNNSYNVAKQFDSEKGNLQFSPHGR